MALDIQGKTYVIVHQGRAIKCLVCRMTSHNPNDVAFRFCGNCNRFHDHDQGPRIDRELAETPARRKRFAHAD